MEVVVVGGERFSMRGALFLTRFCSVTLVHRKASCEPQKSWRKEPLPMKITPLWDSAVKEVLPDEDGSQTIALKISSREEKVLKVPCKGVFIAIGHVPNTSAFEGIIP